MMTKALIRAGLGFASWALASAALGHSIEGGDASFVASIDGPAVGPFIYLGAKHMVTGYDHLLFLVGVIFFLFKPTDVIKYVTLFAAGHSITLIAGVLGGVQVNAYAIDAIIGLSIVYKAFDNLGGFQRIFGLNLNAKWAVFVFGLFHGLGLATKLQEFDMSTNGLAVNLLSFNLGVEIGQVLALSGIFVALTLWRTQTSYLRHAFATNAILMTGGFLLMGYQLSGLVLAA
jgi:hypothetical protein